MWSTSDPFEPKDTSRLKVKEWRSIFHDDGPQKKAGVAIFISYKLDFELKTVVRHIDGHYIILKGSIHQEDLTMVNIYIPNMGAANYISQLLIKIKNQGCLGGSVGHSLCFRLRS